MERVEAVVDAQRHHEDGKQVGELRTGDEGKAQPLRDRDQVADEALHPQQGSTERDHDDGHVGRATQGDEEQHCDGEAHQRDQARTGLELTVDFDVDALPDLQADAVLVVLAQHAFEFHHAPFHRARTPAFLDHGGAGGFVVVWRVQHQFAFGQPETTDDQPFVGHAQRGFLCRVLPGHRPTGFGHLAAVELNEQPRGACGPATLADQIA